MSTPVIASRFGRLGGPILLAAFAVLCLLPFLVLCWYAHPSADDFLQANDVRKHGHWGYMPYMYLNWTGRYTSLLLWGLLHPVVYGNTTEGYGLVCLALLAALPCAFYALFRSLLAGAFRRYQLWLAAGIGTALFLLQMPSPAEAFYWITSTYNYLLPALLTLLWLAVVVRHAVATQPAACCRWLVAASLLAVVIIGGNETNALPLAVGVTGFTVMRSLQRRRILWHYVALTAVVGLACAAAFLAPGNFMRMGQPDQQFPLPQAVQLAVQSAYQSVANWLGNGVLIAFTVLLAPLSYRLWRLPDLPLNRLAQNPLFITLLMPVVLVLVMLLAWWSTRQILPFRAQNSLYLFFLIGWFLNAHAWLRYLWRRTEPTAFALPWYIQTVLIGWIAALFAVGHTWKLSGNEPHENVNSTNNIVEAYHDWLDGTAARYDAQLTARYQSLRYSDWSGSTDAVVEPLQSPPRTLLFGDITTDVYDWSNQAYAEFFGKKTIRTDWH
ncbi:hypothetical protein F0P96_09350 [Hymenobacter busanensis]|uniref:Uncharacterized protein n=1 Tax=Hymenobacter busanensis TaxID=2607656 RepID=A0A7L4ZXB1_9BACT|nr:DUF6056 family protein [Hymenobacter busanensis]KAA9333175.1 hypothetical protein F0P96_09350 [Hymenobacter busanensis]QHJ08149.1 hypothetical protein GUY19_12975 [Hymenobacter busanensis]